MNESPRRDTSVHFEKESPEDSLLRCSDELAWCVEQAEAAGVVFSVEAHAQGQESPTTRTPGEERRCITEHNSFACDESEVYLFFDKQN